MTALQRILERLPDEHREPFLRLVNEAGLREDSPDLFILALEHEARWAAVEAMRAERQRMAGMLADLPDAMRASGIEIVRGLGDDVASATTTGIKSEVLPMLQRAADVMAEHVEGLVDHAKQATRSTTDAADANIAAASGAMSQASSTLAKAASKVGGWTPSRLASIGLGVVFATGMFVAGNAVHAGDLVFGCGARVEHVAHTWHLSAYDTNALRNYVCRG